MVVIPTEKRFDWKHAPLVLITIVIINVAVYTFYQSQDSSKLDQAINQYLTEDFLTVEWVSYQSYLSDRQEDLAQAKLLYEQNYYDALAAQIVMDTKFARYIDRSPPKFKDQASQEDWEEERENINNFVADTSFIKYGLIPSEKDPITFISHQFLHGGPMHLIGNLFFLIICGFAVEAAIGHLRFLLFYLISGLIGGGLHVFTNLESAMPLVGASGAISGVMAMYLGIFRFKKIEFFYWFYIFVGYFRAPALLILPLYIGKELVSYYSNTDSNVAFMAHTGGFLAGALCIATLLLLSPQNIDEEYIEDKQEIDPERAALAKVYSNIDQFRFAAALQVLEQVIDDYGLDFDKHLLKIRLLELSKNKEYFSCVSQLLKTPRFLPRELLSVHEIVKARPQVIQKLNAQESIKLGIQLSVERTLESAETIIEHLLKNKNTNTDLGIYARKLSLIYEKLGYDNKKKRFEALADQFLRENSNGVL